MTHHAFFWQHERLRLIKQRTEQQSLGATYYDDTRYFTLQEVYFLFVILIVPTCVMGFSYGKIIVEICKVVKQRYHLTQSSATERKTSEVQTQQQIEMTPFQKVSEGAEVPALAQSQGNITEEHEIKTEKEEPINQPKMDNDTKQVNFCLNFLGVETILTRFTELCIKSSCWAFV